VFGNLGTDFAFKARPAMHKEGVHSYSWADGEKFNHCAMPRLALKQSLSRKPAHDSRVRNPGSVDVCWRTALLCQRARGKARDAANGCSLGKSRNAASHTLARNPKGRDPFGAGRRCSELIWNNQTAFLAPCPAPN